MPTVKIFTSENHCKFSHTCFAIYQAVDQDRPHLLLQLLPLAWYSARHYHYYYCQVTHFVQSIRLGVLHRPDRRVKKVFLFVHICVAASDSHQSSLQNFAPVYIKFNCVHPHCIQYIFIFIKNIIRIHSDIETIKY